MVRIPVYLFGERIAEKKWFVGEVDFDEHKRKCEECDECDKCDEF